MSETFHSMMGQADDWQAKQALIYGDMPSLYRTAAALASLQTTLSISPLSMVRIHQSLIQAMLIEQPNTLDLHAQLAALAALAGAVIPSEGVTMKNEEAIDETGKRLAQAFAPVMPNIANPPTMG
jgi:hypothetical protein